MNYWKIPFYHYKKGKVQKTPKAAVVPQTSKDEGAAKALTSDTLTDRLMLSMLNESVACLRDGVVHDADALDIGMILGTGFAPFRAGPMHYAHDRGVDEIIATLESLASSVGSRFEPDAGWHEWVAPKHDASASLSDKPQDDAGQVHDASDACDEGTVPLK